MAKCMRGLRQRSICRIRLCLCVLAAVFLLSACGDGSGSRIVFTSGLGKDEVFRIGSSVCTVSEMTVYLTNTKNQYEKVYGEQVWEISRDGVTLEENVKETVLAKLAQVKTMYLLAESREVTLDERENVRAEQAGAEYFASLNEKEKELMGIDEEIIVSMYKEYAAADKVYRDIIRDVNPEISDDEARNITIEQIFISIDIPKGQEEESTYSEEAREAAYEKASEVHELAVDGEHDFFELAVRYSDDTVVSCSFGKGEKAPAFEQAAFALETGEVSRIIEADGGYYIIKCISTFDRTQTDINKLRIVEERRREAFGQEYDTFVATLARQLNTELWEGMTLLRDKEVTTSDFFDIYEKYFPEE